MSSPSRIAIVTGSNKGIGLACIRQLAFQYPGSAFNNGPLCIYLTARSNERGQAALKIINDDPQLKSAKALQSQGGLAEIRFLTLDIESSDSIQKFCKEIKNQHPEGIDFLINNAGMVLNGFDADIVKTTLHCNYFGTLEATTRLLSQMKDGGRLVNVASLSGSLSGGYSDEIQQRFSSATTPAQITQLMHEFAKAAEDSTYEGQWPPAAYAVSKCGVIGMTRTLAMVNAQTGSKTLINSCCPGFVVTDMTKTAMELVREGGPEGLPAGLQAKSVDEGAMTPVLLALGDIKGSNGDVWQSEEVQVW